MTNMNVAVIEESQIILVVDDEEANLQILETYLTEAGYEVVTAENGAEAWDFVKLFGERVSVILLDRMMPVMDGIEFMKLLKGHRLYSDIPVIMQTAAALKEQVIECKNSGIYHYLRKPFEEERVLQLVREALSGFRNLREVRRRNLCKNNSAIDSAIDQDIFKNIN
jgi:CheY-like chemotaxis protein